MSVTILFYKSKAIEEAFGLNETRSVMEQYCNAIRKQAYFGISMFYNAEGFS